MKYYKDTGREGGGERKRGQHITWKKVGETETNQQSDRREQGQMQKKNNEIAIKEKATTHLWLFLMYTYVIATNYACTHIYILTYSYKLT